MKLPWLAENIKQFASLVQAQRIPHAILLSASKGMGKEELAKEMAHLAMCENITDNGVCYQCGACNLLKAGNHTDLSVIKAENAIIKVGQIRKLSSDVVLTASKNQHKVIIIEEAEKMNASSANALLKTLEEPPQKVLIILTTNEIGQLLPTIKSRCVKINIKPASYEVANQWLMTQVSASADDISIAQFLTSNSPLLARSVLCNNVIDDVKQMVNDMEELKQQTVALLDVSKKWLANNWHLNLNFIAVILLNQLALQYNLQSKNGIGFTAIAQGSDLHAFIKSIHKFNKRLVLSLKTELQLEKLLIVWKEC